MSGETLASELIGEMKRANPSAFGSDGSFLGSQPTAQMGPESGPASGPQQGQPDQQLQQQFMMVLQQNPQLQQSMTPQLLQQALNDPAMMMNIITQAQQAQMAPPIPSEPSVEEPKELKGPVNYVETEDIPLPPAIANVVEDASWTTRLFEVFKLSIVLTIIYLIVSNSTVQQYLVNLVPKIGSSELLKTAVFAICFLALSSAVIFFLSS